MIVLLSHLTQSICSHNRVNNKWKVQAEKLALRKILIEKQKKMNMQLSGKILDFSIVWLTCTENGDYMEGVRMQGTKCKGRSPLSLTL